MKVTNKIDIHLDDLRHIPPINVMQADAYTRVLEFSLYSGGVAWNVPEGVDVAVAYIGSSGKGIYDTLPDGAAACTVNGNVVTAVVAPQAVAMDGNTNLSIIFTDGEGHQLAAFCVTLKVERNPAVNATKPPDYINLRQWMTAELANLVWDYAVNVYADQAGDGYVSERPYDAILREYESGRAMYCALEISDQERLQLPFVKIDGGVLYFSAVCAGKEYMVTINADGVTVEISECGGGNSGGNVDQSGLTKAQIAALDGMFKVCAYDGNPADAYLAFKTAFGIADTEETIPCTNISLNVNTLEFANNEPLTLTATVEPSNTTDVVVWKSSNASIATVKNGVVTPIANGNCTITATCGEKQAVCSVSIDMGEIVMYSVTNTLSYVTNDNSNASVQEGSSYTANLTPYDSYTLVDVTVTMGGVDITSTVYSNGVITIPSVTGNIAIVANAIGGSYVPGEGTAIGYTKGYALNKDGIAYENELASVSDFIDYEASSVDRQVTVYGCTTHTCSYNNGVLVDYWQTSYNVPTTKNFANANSNQLRFSIDNTCIDVAYAYFTATGEVLFAMKNSEYYGKTNIND